MASKGNSIERDFHNGTAIKDHRLDRGAWRAVNKSRQWRKVNGRREVARRVRQIASGWIKFANGLLLSKFLGRSEDGKRFNILKKR